MFRDALERKSREDHDNQVTGSGGGSAGDSVSQQQSSSTGRPAPAKDAHGRHASASATFDVPTSLAPDVPIPGWFPCADHAPATTAVTITEGAGVHESLLRASRWDTVLAVAVGSLHVTLFDAAVGGEQAHPRSVTLCPPAPAFTAIASVPVQLRHTWEQVISTKTLTGWTR